MSGAPITRRALTAAVFGRLQTVANATHFLGEPGVIPMEAGYATPYTCLWPGLGNPDVELDLADTTVDLSWDLAITCAAGFTTDVTALVDRVMTALYRWSPAVDGLVCGPLRPPDGYAPAMLLDRDVTPHRPYTRLEFRSTITA